MPSLYHILDDIFVATYFRTRQISRDPVLTGEDEGHVLQVREQEVLAGPQIAHGGSRCVGAGTQLVDHLREEDNGRKRQIRNLTSHKYIKATGPKWLRSTW